MANRLQIKKNVTNDSAPSSLEGGELAYTVNTNTVYVGSFGDLSGISVLSDGDTVVRETGGSEMLVMGDTDGSNTVTLQAPVNLTDDVTLKLKIAVWPIGISKSFVSNETSNPLINCLSILSTCETPSISSVTLTDLSNT